MGLGVPFTVLANPPSYPQPQWAHLQNGETLGALLVARELRALYAGVATVGLVPGPALLPVSRGPLGVPPQFPGGTCLTGSWRGFGGP